MGTISHLFDTLRGMNPLRRRELPEDTQFARERARRMSSPVLQTPEEQAGIRRHMEEELDAQRARRAHPGPSSA